MSEPSEKDIIKDAISIEPLALEEEFVRLPADLAFWNERYADVLRAYLRAEHNVDRTWAQRYLDHRDDPDAERKPTEATIKAQVEVDPRYVAARERRDSLAADKARVAGIVDAIKAKRDALISIGAHIRAELAGDPRIRTTAASRRGTRGDSDD